MMSTHPLPEKVLQFGTGILLRGLPDYFIDEANRHRVFNGSIVMVKSTPGPPEDWKETAFTICIRGLEKGRKIEKDILNAAISRVLSARTHWNDVLNIAADPKVQLIISNTTEVGIQLVRESIFENPPASFPAKLTACLYKRFKQLGDRSPLLVVIPTELLPDNGIILKDIVVQLAHHNQLDSLFLNWLEQKVLFCNSLVDRIVTRPSKQLLASQSDLNALTIQTEPYKLWAIEGGEDVRNVLSFATVDPAVLITSDIEFYRERKLRLLNGGGTMMACLGFLQGLKTVYECLTDSDMAMYVEKLLMEEIEPTLPETTREDTQQFARDILERWRNEYTVHHLINITLQGTAKMKMRNVPTFFRYSEKFKKLPALLCRGYAAHLLFMKSTRQEGDRYFGISKGEPYPIQDDQAAWFSQQWRDVNTKDEASVKNLVGTVSNNTGLWGRDLTQLPMFAQTITKHLMDLIAQS